MEKTVWESSVTEEMIFDAGLSKSDVKRLVKELDDAVMEICQNSGIGG
jgi:hypothetical protein